MIWKPSRVLVLALPLFVAAPAGANEEETDDLTFWMEEELEDASGWEFQELQSAAPYGSDIPDPADVMRGGPPAPSVSHAPPPQRAAQGPAPRERVEFADFYSGLHPHGRWVDSPEYGMIFIPGAHIQVAGWRPYLHGQWVWTSYGWTWVSEEPFGWATYHYGRWSYAPAWGWFWVPGYVWGPAWVAWRYGPDSIGWAPLYPGYVTVGARYPVHVDHWIFVGHRHFHGHPVHRHWYRGKVHHHFHRSHWAKHWRYSGRVYAGPPRRWVEKRHGRGRIVETRIVHSRRPSVSQVVGRQGGREVRVYRPGVAGAVRPERRALPPTVRVRNGRPAAGSGLVREAPARRSSPQRRDVRPPTQRSSPQRREVAPPNQRSSPQRREVAPPSQRSSPQRRDVSPPSQRSSPQRQRVAPPTQRSSPQRRDVRPPSQRSSPQRRQQAPSIRSGGATRSNARSMPARSSTAARPAPSPRSSR